MEDSATSPVKFPNGAPRGLWLIGAETGFPYAPLIGDKTVDLSDPSLPWHLDIGYFPEHPIAGVVYKYQGKKVTATKPPYRLLTSDPPSLPAVGEPPAFSKTFPPGHYTITAEPFAAKKANSGGGPLTVNLTTIESIVSKKHDTQNAGGYAITPFTVSNEGTSPVSLYGPHLYPAGRHILARGGPPLAFGRPLGEEFTVPGNNINFVTSFTWRGKDQKDLQPCTAQTLEHPGGSPFVLQPGQSLDLQLVEPIKKPQRPPHTMSGVGGGSGPGQGKPPLPP